MQELNQSLANNLGVFFEQLKYDVEKGLEEFILNNNSLLLEKA